MRNIQLLCAHWLINQSISWAANKSVFFFQKPAIDFWLRANNDCDGPVLFPFDDKGYNCLGFLGCLWTLFTSFFFFWSRLSVRV
jgi:hypothetical protein